MNPDTAPKVGRSVNRPIQVHALVALWANKGFQELLSGVIGGGFYIWGQAAQGKLSGYALQVGIQSTLFSGVMAAGSFYVMIALWLGKRAARGWGVAFALVNELSVLAYLITRPPEFGGDIALIRTVVIATIVNLGVVWMLLFDQKLALFLGNTRLVGWWAPRR